MGEEDTIEQVGGPGGHLILPGNRGPASDANSALPRSIDRFEILRKIGEGGMADIFLAIHPVTGSEVAVKRLKPHLVRERRQVQRFLTEARHMYHLNHPHILSDFGLVRDFGTHDPDLDVRQNHLLGTVPYMSPAVAHGEVEDTRRDIYTFGAMLYELLTGHLPYCGNSAAGVLEKIMAGPPVPILRRNSHAPLGLAEIASGAMARELRDRYSSMADVLRDLERIEHEQRPLGRTAASAANPAPGLAKAAAAAAVTIALIVAAVAARHHWPSRAGQGPVAVTVSLPQGAHVARIAPSPTAKAPAPTAAAPARQSGAAAVAPVSLQTTTDAAGHRVVDLMPLIDPARDARGGTWTLDKGGVAVSAGWDHGMMLEIPYVPPSEYDFRIEFTRTKGDEDVQQLLCHNFVSFSYGMDEGKGDHTGFEQISGNDTEHPTVGFVHGRAPMANGVRHVSIVSVRNGSVSATLDGQPVIRFVTDYSNLGPREDHWDLGEPVPGVGAWNSEVSFHSLQVTEIAGRGQWLGSLDAGPMTDLLKDGSFTDRDASDPDATSAAWGAWYPKDAVKFVRDTDVFRSAPASLRMTLPGGHLLQTFRLPASGLLHVTGFYKTTPDSKHVDITANLGNSAGVGIGRLFHGAAADWTPFSLYCQLPQPSEAGTAWLSLEAYGTGTVWFDDVHVFHLPGASPTTMPAQPALVSTLKSGTVWKLAFRPDGKLVDLQSNNTGSVFDPGQAKQIDHWVTGHDADISLDGTLLFRNGSVYSTDPGHSLPIRRIADDLRHPRFSPDGKILVAQAKSGGSYVRRAFAVPTGAVLGNFGEPGGLETVEPFSADSRYFVTWHGDGDVQVYDTRTWSLQATERGAAEKRPSQRGYPFPDGKKILLINDTWGGNGSAVIWDWHNDRKTVLFEMGPHWVRCSGAVSPDGNWVIACDSKSTRLWNGADGTPARTLDDSIPDGNCDSVHSMAAAAFSPDSKRVLVGYCTGRAYLFDVASGKLLAEYQGEQGTFNPIVFSPDGRYAATAHPAEDNVIRVWKMPE